MWSCQEQGQNVDLSCHGAIVAASSWCAVWHPYLRACRWSAFRFAQVCSGFACLSVFVGPKCDTMWHKATLEVSQSVSPFLPELLIRMFFASLNSSWCRRGWYMVIHAVIHAVTMRPSCHFKSECMDHRTLMLVQQQTFDTCFRMLNVFTVQYLLDQISTTWCFQGAEISFPGNRHPTWCWRSCRLRTLGWCCRRQ